MKNTKYVTFSSRILAFSKSLRLRGGALITNERLEHLQKLINHSEIHLNITLDFPRSGGVEPSSLTISTTSIENLKEIESLIRSNTSFNI